MKTKYIAYSCFYSKVNGKKLTLPIKKTKEELKHWHKNNRIEYIIELQDALWEALEEKYHWKKKELERREVKISPEETKE